jgi:hypothetical protein
MKKRKVTAKNTISKEDLNRISVSRIPVLVNQRRARMTNAKKKAPKYKKPLDD